MSNKIKRTETIPDMPMPAGPYSQTVIADQKLLFVSGQGPFDAKLGKVVRGSIAEQTQLTLDCLKTAIESAGGNIQNVLSCRVFLQPLNEETFAEMNVIYREFFGVHKPTRTTVGTTLLNIDVEIDCIVLLD